MTQRSFSSPSQHAWNVALQDIQAAQKADEVYNKVRLAIEQHTSLLKRDVEVRVKVWMTKLSEQTNNPVWKKNRNAYAKLLLYHLKQGQLREPFHTAPPQGPLQTLPASLTYASSIARTGSFKSTIRSGMSVCSSEGSPPKHSSTAIGNLQDYQGRHATSPHRTTSAGTTTLALDTQAGQQEASDMDQTHTRPRAQQAQHAQRRSSLWGMESFDSHNSAASKNLQSQHVGRKHTDASSDRAQPSVAGLTKAKSTSSQHTLPKGQKSPSRQASAVSWYEAEAQSDGQPCTSRGQPPVIRQPSRLQQFGSTTLPERPSRHTVGRRVSSTEDSSSTDQEESHQCSHRRGQQHKHMQPMQCNGAALLQKSPRTAEDYMRRAGLHPQQQATSNLGPQQQGQKPQSPSQSPPYAAKARILDLHDSCTLAETEHTLRRGRGGAYSPARGSERDGQGGASVRLGGTNMRLAGRGCGHDPIDLADESWQPTKLELQARLGASKERQLELEWRLQQAEQKVAHAQARQVQAEMQLQDSDQLRWQSDKQRQLADQPKSTRMKKDLGKLIDKYEKKQSRWGSPTKAAYLAHLTPLEAYRDSSSSNSLSSLDSFAEIAAALQDPCKLASSLDLGLLTQHPHAAHGPAAQAGSQAHDALQRPGQDAAPLSGGSSQPSVHSDTQQQDVPIGEQPDRQHQQQHLQPQQQQPQQHQQQQQQLLYSQQYTEQQQQQRISSLEGAAVQAEIAAMGPAYKAAEEEHGSSSFMQRLQDFKRGTDALRRQVRVS